MGFRSAAFAAIAILSLAAAAQAQDHSSLYSDAELAQDAERLEARMRQLYEIGVLPFLTPAEKTALADAELFFPLPEEGDFALDFYAFREDGKHYAAMPILSLKMLEDLSVAYAWIYSQKLSFGTIDLYFAMLQRPDASAFPGGRYPAIMPALGVPADAYKHPPVDDLSLRFRNEAFAFALMHELGHIVLGHKEYFEVTPEQAQADEAAADRFALDLMGRSGTPALGVALMFQAQAYSLPHRGQFASEKEWLDHQHERATHPVTTERVKALAAFASGPLAAARPQEAETWRYVGQQLLSVAKVLEDEELQLCMAKVAEKADMAALKPRTEPSAQLLAEACL